MVMGRCEAGDGDGEVRGGRWWWGGARRAMVVGRCEAGDGGGEVRGGRWWWELLLLRHARGRGRWQERRRGRGRRQERGGHISGKGRPCAGLRGIWAAIIWAEGIWSGHAGCGSHVVLEGVELLLPLGQQRGELFDLGLGLAKELCQGTGSRGLGELLRGM